jgi:cell division protein FtsB
MSEGLREKFANWFTVFAVALILVGGIVLTYSNMRRNLSLRRQNAELREVIEQKKAEIARLKENQRRFRQDADFVESIARQNNRVLPGEYVFIFDKE